MGRFLDRGNADFVSARNGEYVDKSAMIQYIIEEQTDKSKKANDVKRLLRHITGTHSDLFDIGHSHRLI